MTASLPLPGLPTLDAPAPPPVRIPHSARGQARIAAAGARSDLAALVNGDRVTVYLGERPVGVRVVRGIVGGGRRVSVEDPQHAGCAEHYSARDGSAMRSGGPGVASIRPYRVGDRERIRAWNDIEHAEAANRVWLGHAAQIEDATRVARLEVERLEALLPAARYEARAAASALSDARTRLARIDEEGGT